MPVKPLPRVSATRHGEMPMNGSGLVTSVSVWTPKVLDGDQVAGADQFAMDSPPRARPARKTVVKLRNETLRVSTEHLL